MADRIVGSLFSVMWRRTPKSSVQRGEYEAPSLGDLLKILNRAENVSSQSCDEIVVHLHKGKETHEVYVHDKATSVIKFDFTKHTPDALHAPQLNKKQKRQQRRLEEEAKRQAGTRVRHGRNQDEILQGAALALQGLIQEKKDRILTRAEKPHIKLLPPPVGPSVTASYGLYRAYKA